MVLSRCVVLGDSCVYIYRSIYKQIDLSDIFLPFRLLVKRSIHSKPFIACLASQLLKDGHPKLGLMQRAVAIFLYGNGSSKQACDIQSFYHNDINVWHGLMCSSS